MRSTRRAPMMTAIQPSAFFQFAIASSLRLESLPQCDEELRRADASRGVQIVSDVDPHRADGGRVTQPYANRITVMVDEIREIDSAVNVTSVIKDYPAQVAHNGDRVAQLGIKDEELIPPDRDGNLRTVGLARGAEGNVTYRAGFIDGEAAQGGPPAGKKSLAGRHLAACKGSRQAQAHAVGEHHPVHGLVIGV